MTPRRLHITLGIIMAVLAGPVTSTRGQAIDADRASKIKAGMVLNFIRYTEWPETTFDSGERPIVITVLGEDSLIHEIEQTVRGQQAHGRAVEIRRLNYPQPVGGSPVSEDRLREYREQLRASQVVFICRSEVNRLDSILQDVGASDVLTVSDIDDFAERGGMLGLTLRDDRVAFDANPDEIQETQLKVSSQLLRLARTVKSRSE